MIGKFSYTIIVFLALIVTITSARAEELESSESFDVIVVGGTPGGIMAAIAAARHGHTVLILERSGHIGGLPANGLGATDIDTPGATGGLFLEFVQRIAGHYEEAYGPDTQPVKDSSGGYHFEPHVAERVFEEMLAEKEGEITVRKRRQFDALPQNVVLENGTVVGVRIFNRDTNGIETYPGKIFIDATYEGDLAAAAGAPYRLGREGKGEFDEPMAGRLYTRWRSLAVGSGSTGLADNAIQAYNYRLCVTREVTNLVPIPKPERYNREEYLSLIDDIKLGRMTGEIHPTQMAMDGIGRILNLARLPNGKTDANNQHLAFISTDLPEENWPWPTSAWDWRDRYAERLRDYTLGLL